MRILAAAATIATAAALGALPAAATPPEPVTFVTDGQITTPGTIVGTWHATGAIVDAGTYVEHFRLMGNGRTMLKFEKELVGAHGTTVLGGVTSLTPTGAFGSGGGWQINSGTGAYATLRAGGHPTVRGTVDLATGVVHAVHVGTAHFNPAS